MTHSSVGGATSGTFHITILATVQDHSACAVIPTVPQRPWSTIAIRLIAAPLLLPWWWARPALWIRVRRLSLSQIGQWVPGVCTLFLGAALRELRWNPTALVLVGVSALSLQWNWQIFGTLQSPSKIHTSSTTLLPPSRTSPLCHPPRCLPREPMYCALIFSGGVWLVEFRASH